MLLINLFFQEFRKISREFKKSKTYISDMGASNSSDLQKTKNNDTFNQNDLEIVKKTWNSIENLEEFGVSIMIYIFLEHKEIKGKWIFASNLETETEMRQNSQVKYHSKKVVDVLILLLSKLKSVEDFKNEDINLKLYKLGESHYHYNVSTDHFSVCVKFIFLNDHQFNFVILI